MAAITRTFKSFELTAYELDDSIPPSVRPAAQYVVLDTNMNARKARIAFRDAGVALPKDCLIKWVEGEEIPCPWKLSLRTLPSSTLKPSD